MKSVLLLCLATFGGVQATPAKTVFLSDTEIAHVILSLGRSTVLSFPLKPSKVILGSHGLFAVEYVENDLAITALSPNATSNLFVYLEGRRFAFDLKTVAAGGDEIVVVRDASEKKAGGKR